MYIFFLSSTSPLQNLSIFFQIVDRGSCKGDSGAPLFGYVQGKNHNIRVAYGVVHGCIGQLIGACCSIDYPSVFTSLGDSDVLDFVRDIGITANIDINTLTKNNTSVYIGIFLGVVTVALMIVIGIFYIRRHLQTFYTRRNSRYGSFLG